MLTAGCFHRERFIPNALGNAVKGCVKLLRKVILLHMVD